MKTSAVPKDLLAVPVMDLDDASRRDSEHFGMREVERRAKLLPAVVLERDGVRLGFDINGGDAAQDGVPILVSALGSM